VHQHAFGLEVDDAKLVIFPITLRDSCEDTLRGTFLEGKYIEFAAKTTRVCRLFGNESDESADIDVSLSYLCILLTPGMFDGHDSFDHVLCISREPLELLIS